jgi:mono/diheme cytochrome c family protein
VHKNQKAVKTKSSKNKKAVKTQLAVFQHKANQYRLPEGVMKKRVLAASLSALAALSFTISSSLLANERVGDFALLDHEGLFHHIAWYDNRKAVVLLTHTNDSRAVRDALPTFQSLMAAHAGDFQFFMLNPLGETRSSVAANVAAQGHDIPVLIDDGQLISEALAVRTAGEALVLDPRSFRVIYRGPVGGLEKAINEVAAGTAISTPELAVSGEVIGYPTRDRNMARTVSYSREVAPILAENCAGCHRDGGIAPFALDSHAMAQGWSPMIREVLMTKRMPPGSADHSALDRAGLPERRRSRSPGHARMAGDRMGFW